MPGNMEGRNKLTLCIATAMVFFVYLSRGLMFTVPGPTLLELAFVTNASIEYIPMIFAGRGIGLIIGCLLLGFVVKDWQRSAMFFLTFASGAVAFGFAPWIKNLVAMAFAFGLNGFGMGYLEAGANYFLVKLWGEKSPRAIAFAVSGFIIGATVAPLIAYPFLPVDIHANSTNGANYSQAPLASLLQSNVTVREIPVYTSGEINNIQTLFFIVMAISVASVLGLSVSSAVVGYIESEGTGEKIETEAKIPKGTRRIVLIGLMFLFITVLIGLELNFYGMISSYVVLELRGTEQEGTLITSLFWGAYTVFSLVGIVTLAFFTPSTVLFANLIFITLSNVVLVVCPPGLTTLKIGTALLGIGFGSTYAGVFIWGDYYMKLDHKISAILVAGGQFGSVLVPLITGPIFARNPHSLMLITLVCALICDVLFVVVELGTLSYVRRYRGTACAFGRLKTGREGYEQYE